MNTSERKELRRLVDAAKRGELEHDQRLTLQVRRRTRAQIHHEIVQRKAIFAALRDHEAGVPGSAIIAERGADVYLVCVGGGCARILDLRNGATVLSEPEEIHALMAASPDWQPVDKGDRTAAAALRIVDAAA